MDELMNFPELKKAYDMLQRIHDSTNEAVRMLERQVGELTTDNQLLEARNNQLILRVEVQDRVTHQALEDANKKSNEYLQEITRLRTELNGNIN